MEQLGTWGDHVSLQAVCDFLGICITVVTSAALPAFKLQPERLHSQRVLYLSFWSEVRHP